MKLNNREKAWQQRKIVHKESHPTYKLFGAHMGTIQERCKKANIPDAWSKEGIKEREEFAKTHGRAWWVFSAVPVVEKYKDQWIEQFRVIDEVINE